MSSEKIPRYYEIDGFRVDETFTPERFHSAVNYKPNPNDVIIASFPKCGTTWMCQIVRLILMKGKHTTLTPKEYFTCFPFIEFTGAKAVQEMLKPGCIKTHLPFNRLNFSDKAKYIYVTRHPRDCVVSFYHHTKFFPCYRFTDGSFDTYFDLFIRGMTDFNDYFDHIISWYEQRHRSNILFLTYESIKADHQGTVLKIAEFLECPLNEEQVKNVVKYSSFDHMKNEVDYIFANFNESLSDDEIGHNILKIEEKAIKDGHQSVGNFIRKGETGSGKLMLTQEQEQKLKNRILEKTKDSNVMSIWDN